MNRHEKLLEKVLSGRSDANIRFSKLCALLKYLGFNERIHGSHFLYKKRGLKGILSVQNEGGFVPPYQVVQVRETIVEYNLGGKG